MRGKRASFEVFAIGAAFAALAACVPEGPATLSTGAASTSKATVNPQPVRPRSDAAGRPSGPVIASPFEDTFERQELGADWRPLGPQWTIQKGRLCARGARNRGVWLSRRLPINARIEFDAVAESDDGDLKAELWGDGASGATGTSYTNATSYLAILGGWKNTKHVFARIDEHGTDRLEIDIEPNSDDERARAVEPGQPYHFTIERSDGKTVSWSINGLDYFTRVDPEPLAGPGHDHLGFNDWQAPVCFDNVKVTPL